MTHRARSFAPALVDLVPPMTPDLAAAECRGLTKRFGSVAALDAIDLVVPQGQLLGLLGPNGAGKSTLIGLLAGLLSPSAGTIRLFGADPRRPASRRAFGLTPQDTSMPAVLKVREVIAQVAAHYPDPVPVDEILERFGLAELADRPTAKMSGGQRRRLCVALALVGRPRLVALDEPTTGLDVPTRAALWAVLREVRDAGTTIVLSSHHLQEVEALADRVVVIDGGRLLLDDTLEGALSHVDVRYVSARMAADGAARLAGEAGVRWQEDPVGVAQFVVRDADDFVRRLVASGVAFEGLTVRAGSLEEAMAAIVAEEVAA